MGGGAATPSLGLRGTRFVLSVGAIAAAEVEVVPLETRHPAVRVDLRSGERRWFVFAAHPAAFTAVYWVSATGDILALAFALAALLAARRADARRWWAVPLFALSLLSKESTLLLPR